ncbi:TetR/AcrR family transcriptional regulator [Cryobacterium glaciale]|uniref:TetR/AcrR family transcriptional regulator n=1 Tax=Cryobacterium glaciale TaxID=1259145 RepID=A0A4R8UWR3_9MICO|nr:TetR/AcrR family transcriptional regulator [Cryobacterium glaciale]TFB72590.1 TetR/AcrR family transcriptional regulator [Cryobacterium glaciale]
MSSDEGTTPRSRAKADRRTALLTAAATLFARSGFNGVSIEDLGAAVGVSGPAVYRHFSGKPAVLAALLIDVSEDLVIGGGAVVTATTDAAAALQGLVRFHVDFALANPDVIRVQDRDLDSLAESDQHRVRALQREYVELWVHVLHRVHPAADETKLRIRAHATFGLLNSTPHSARASAQPAVRALLEEMALAALGLPAA